MSVQSKKNIAITMGEPAGINIEIITKAVTIPEFSEHNFIIIGDQNLFHHKLPDSVLFHQIDFGHSITMGTCKTDYAPQLIKTIQTGVDLCLSGQADALVTAPINKDNIHALYPNFYGHTDFITDYSNEKLGKDYQSVMMLTCPDLKVVPLTVHIPLADVSKTITSKKIINTALIIHKELQEKYHIQSPRIKIAGLNPHASDNGIMGDEEEKILKPAIKTLKEKGIDISDPASADTMFHPQARRHYDVALCMYHDQALIPIKTIGFDVGVNVTLGLPIIRTSPDHGTALDIAGKNCANPSALIAAINEAIKLSY